MTYTTTFGSDVTYQAFSITVQCVVTSFAAPSDPSDIAYTIFDNMVTLDMADHPYV